MLKNAHTLAIGGVDTAENEPCKVCPLSVYRSPRYMLEYAAPLQKRTFSADSSAGPAPSDEAEKQRRDAEAKEKTDAEAAAAAEVEKQRLEAGAKAKRKKTKAKSITLRAKPGPDGCHQFRALLERFDIEHLSYFSAK